MQQSFFNRDISWLSFNERVLLEANKTGVPVLERLKFLSIYSSNLDEFYRVRIPALMALNKINKTADKDNILEQIKTIIGRQQQVFGRMLRESILPLLCENNISMPYNRPFPDEVKPAVKEYFLTQIATFLHPVYLSVSQGFFPENNKIYLAISFSRDEKNDMVILNIPSREAGRFYSVIKAGIQYLLFLDDIIRESLALILPGAIIQCCHSFKITRDAELNLEDEYEGDIAEKIERQITKRDFGFATRFLYDAAMPEDHFENLVAALQLSKANKVTGGRYHNLKDFIHLPIKNKALEYEEWPAKNYEIEGSIFNRISHGDFLLHPPYQSYDMVLRFFNEAALDSQVSDIFITLYRIAGDSRIAQALISAARNGKKVTVFVELKARFDEANNIRWAKKMKAAGIRIIYSIPRLKVHAKVALIIKRQGLRTVYYGLLGTGNFNESTARFYTDHLLFTANKEMLRELELLFIFLCKRKMPEDKDRAIVPFKHLLVARFNLPTEFLSLIENEIILAKSGRQAFITIKMNNLEEETLINKLYEASNAGVKVSLIIRSICRLIPGVAGMSENISVRRIVDRYLEHGRVFIFHNDGMEKIYLGSADWMNRNIHRRIEVCFPVYEETLKRQLKEIIEWQLADNTQAVLIDENLQNIPVPMIGQSIQSQFEIYKIIREK